MKIGIIGAGSIGLLFAGYLGKHFNVTIFPRRKEQAIKINQNGITVHNQHSSFNTATYASNMKNEWNQQNLIIIAVKQYHLENILPDLKNIDSQIPLLFLQNGMMHLSMINNLESKAIIIGSIEHGALKINDTSVEHNGIGKTNIAAFKGSLDSLEPILKLNHENFLFTVCPNYEEILINKLLVNAMINPLTAILKIKNGELVHNAHYNRIFLELFKEIMVLFPEMDQEKCLNDILLICQNTGNNESSMLKDIKNKKETEVDAIIGYLLNCAKEKKVYLPITNTIYEMIKGMEKRRGV
ncbi:2-dehydropantoate 2-reductase [Heyndrickxia sp. NPDC080065]|uniref:2-dehydropantoate 2-reductase n=1 Tax=Heyndrickxia sp. NPDC080065 TaxID=3390568 RepID=UPI003D07BBEF